MGEVISHVCGACGDSHPTLITLPALLAVFGGYFAYIKSKTVGFCKKLLFILNRSTATTL